MRLFPLFFEEGLRGTLEEADKKGAGSWSGLC